MYQTVSLLSTLLASHSCTVCSLPGFFYNFLLLKQGISYENLTKSKFEEVLLLPFLIQYLHTFVRSNNAQLVLINPRFWMKKIFKEILPTVDSSFIVKQEMTTQFANPFHFHDRYELTWIIHGRGKFYGGNQVMNFAEGDVYFFGPQFPPLLQWRK